MVEKAMRIFNLQTFALLAQPLDSPGYDFWFRAEIENAPATLGCLGKQVREIVQIRYAMLAFERNVREFCQQHDPHSIHMNIVRGVVIGAHGGVPLIQIQAVNVVVPDDLLLPGFNRRFDDAVEVVDIHHVNGRTDKFEAL